MSGLKRSILASILLTALVWPILASADFIEPADGELSGNFLSPTPVALVPNGSTRVSGTVAGRGMGESTDLDYFTVTVPVGQVLKALNVLPGTVGGGATGGFIALFSGATAVNPATAVSGDSLGYYLYRASDAISNINILDDMANFNFPIMGNPNLSQGFTPPLFAGQYTFWIQEGANGPFPYNFELVLSVPAPSTILLFGLAGLAMSLRRYRREDKVSRRKT